MLIFLSIIIIAIVVFIVIMQSRTPDIYQGPVSDHFDGKIFHNLEPHKTKSFLDILRWQFSKDRVKWPEHVDNVPHPPLSPARGLQIKLTFVNHSTFLIQTEHLNILTDPTWSERASPFSFAGPKRVRNPGIDFKELPPIHLVLVSHNHYDHMDISTLKKLNDTFHPVFLVPLGNKKFLERYHIENVIEMDWWQQHKINNAIITFLPTKHWSSRWTNDKMRTLWGGFGIEINHHKIYFAGDTGFSQKTFSETLSRWGQADIALLPIGSYRPRWFMQDSHMNPKEAVEAHLLLKAKHSIPIHFGTFQLSDEGIDEPVKELNEALVELNVSPKDFAVMKEGETRVEGGQEGLG